MPGSVPKITAYAAPNARQRFQKSMEKNWLRGRADGQRARVRFRRNNTVPNNSSQSVAFSDVHVPFRCRTLRPRYSFYQSLVQPTVLISSMLVTALVVVVLRLSRALLPLMLMSTLLFVVSPEPECS
eukprot:10654529-Heterocapsa_arctica.AAC.1